MENLSKYFIRSIWPDMPVTNAAESREELFEDIIYTEECCPECGTLLRNTLVCPSCGRYNND